MIYNKKIEIAGNDECILRTVTGADAEIVCKNFNLTHGETDFLLSYPDENSFTVEQEKEFLEKKESSNNEVEIGAFVEGHLVGTAGIDQIGKKDKVKHRAEFGISIEKAYWRRGIGRALINACIECAKQAGYSQLELDAVSTNAGAIALYQSVGFIEFGRNPRGFRNRSGEWQEVVLMRLELN